MRDSHRLKEKYELSLDNRQIVTITVASLIVLGGVFMLGVVVGKKLTVEAAANQPQQKQDLLSQLDQKTDALENVKADAALTFQDELTRKTPTLVAEAPVVKPAEVAPKPVEAAPVVKPAEIPSGDPRPPAGVSADVIAEPVAEKPSLPETPRVEAVATRTVDAGGAKPLGATPPGGNTGLREAFGKVQKTPEAPTPIANDGSWTVQLSAYQDRGEADRFADGLRDKGYAPYIVEANIPGKGTWYRVRMGRFGSKDQATRYMDDFRRETAMNAIVTTAN
ncbi:MAG: SPOR domain-containing protein [Archangium sp.]|nr:SPOR domain-containing protein [Archangium sp.]